MKKYRFFFFFFFFFQLTCAQPPNHQKQTPYNVNPNFRPSLAVTVAILSASFVFIALFSFYIRRCSRQTYANRGSFRGVNARSRPAPRGLDPCLIDTFPTFVYSVVKGLKIGKGALECAVCLNEFEDDEILRLLPNCDHVFHPDCIDAWLGSHITCPVCRTDLSLPPQHQHEHEPASEVVPEAGATEEAPSGIGSQANAIQTDNDSQEQVLISINDQGSQAQVLNPNEILSKNRSGRSKSRRFPRSHSTGHSLVHQAENFDRFTLRLPADVRKQIINGKLNRSASCVTFATRQGSVSASRRGRNPLFGRFDRSGKSDRWGFFWRNPSGRASRKVDGSVKALGVKADNSDSHSHPQSSTARPPV